MGSSYSDQARNKLISISDVTKAKGNCEAVIADLKKELTLQILGQEMTSFQILQTKHEI